LEEVIQTIIEAQRFREGNPEAEGGDFSITVSDNESTDVQPTSQPWRDVYEMAEAHYYGLGDTIQDKAEALKLYKQAAKLGCPAAFRKMGDIYHNEYSNSQKALEYFKQGVQMGDDRCWAEMGAVYFAEKHFENADKCWDKYFGSAHFRDNTDYDEPSSDRLWYSITYIRWMDAVKRRARHRDELSPIKRELIQRCNNLINSFRERGSNNLVNRCRKDLELVKKI
jgi:TPR repeat protein